MVEATYIGGKGEGEGPLVKACQQVFTWEGAGDLIVVIWHSDWKDDPEFWNKVAKTMAKAEPGTRTLITFFGESLDQMRSADGGDRLPLLFRLLGRVPFAREGCCRITDFERLGKAPVPFNPADAETALLLRSNQIMGLSFVEPCKQ